MVRRDLDIRDVTTLVVDYSYARPSPATIRGYGAVGVIRYLSGGTSAKDITEPEFSALLAEGFSVALVWEAGPSAALGGRARGVADAAAANAQADAVGFPASRPLYYAVDFDASAAQIPAVLDYLRGAATGARRVGVYGGIRVIDAVHAAGLADFYWQTAAWSGGHVSAARHLLQATFLADVDIDEVTPGVTDWGQTMATLWLPAATRDQHGNGLAWTETTDPKGCLHTTETLGWPSYQGWTVEPHGTVMPHPGVGVEIREHLPLNVGSFSLRHTQSQPTNTDYVWQWELIGTCDPNAPSSLYFWPEADDAVLRDLGRKLIAPLSAAYGIPLVAPKWLAYPASFGASAVRMSNSEFDTYSGWLGHEHVPQNDHGDPGLFPWTRLMTLMGEDMPLTNADADLVIDRLLARKISTGWNEDGSFDPNPAHADTPTVGAIWTGTRGNVLATSNGKTPPQVAAAAALASANAALVAANGKLDALTSAVAGLPETILAGIPVTGNGLTKADVLVACEAACASAINSTRLVIPA